MERVQTRDGAVQRRRARRNVSRGRAESLSAVERRQRHRRTMRLLWSSRSPFARKVMIVAHELGIADRIETERVVVNSVSPNLDVMRFNPPGKLPALLLDSGG